MYLEGNSQVIDIISSAQRASMRASDLTNQLRTFAKGSSLIKQPILINKFLQDSVQFALRGSNVSSEFNLSEDTYLEIDEGQINQVINNLVINAKQAMPDGGEVKIYSELVSIENQRGIVSNNGNFIKISIIDEGMGIPADNLSKIFDPYFTTKDKGNGLGLATSYSIVQKHDGFITVDSEENIGTQFDIYLPVQSDEIYKKVELPRDLELKGQGTLLLMDDEEEIRLSVSKMLRKVGYKVDCVENGEEAIEFFDRAKNSGTPYDAVILDLTIQGGMGGVETVKKLKEIDPEVYCIVSSGYSAGPVIEQYINYGFSAYLNKPFSIKDLKEVLIKIQDYQNN